MPCFFSSVWITVLVRHVFLLTVLQCVFAMLFHLSVLPCLFVLCYSSFCTTVLCLFCALVLTMSHACFCFVSLFITAFACRVCFFCLANACWTGLVFLFLQCCSACFSLFSTLQHSSCHCFSPVCLTALLCLLAVFYSGSVFPVCTHACVCVCVLKCSHP